MDKEELKCFIKEKRSETYPSTLDSVFDSFIKLNLHNEDTTYFLNNASDIIEQLRNLTWEDFLEIESQFTQCVLGELISDDVRNNPSIEEGVYAFIQENTEAMYVLSLSNTQSRRSRAGSEFEHILSLLFMGANIAFDEQGLIGSGIFDTRHLAKLVDHVIPGVTEYKIHKRDTIAISAKTTLRERWQQVGDEMSRTRMPEMYLATLDETIGDNTIEKLQENNVYPVTTRTIKNMYYSTHSSVMTFEELLRDLTRISNLWTIDRYSEEQIKEIKNKLNLAISNNEDKEYIKNYFERQLARFEQ